MKRVIILFLLKLYARIKICTIFFCREVRGAKLVCHRKPLRGLTALGKDTCT